MLDLAIQWNVDPVIFHIGSFGVRWYSMGFLLAFLLGYYILSSIFKREKVRSEYLETLLLYMFLAILVGARLGHCIFYDYDYFFTSNNPAGRSHVVEVFWPFRNGHFTGFSGLASHGAAIGIFLALWLYWKKYRLNAWWLLDRLAIVVALGGMFIRIGNLFNSEIYGTETSLPWGFVFLREGETVPKHPTGLYEALAYLLIFIVSYCFYRRRKGQFRTGTLFGWWLVALFGARFLIEFVKTNGVVAGSPLLMGQLLSLPLIVGGLVIAWLGHREKFPQGPFPQGEVKEITRKWDEKAEKERLKNEQKKKKQ
ncbi:MAG: prolipoprotein diacylglyceryl transferase [Bacteroidales bacterium]|nr:prolipoprotein diacylglyceryl transferase [Bacteroidales bacterium]